MKTLTRIILTLALLTGWQLRAADSTIGNLTHRTTPFSGADATSWAIIGVSDYYMTWTDQTNLFATYYDALGRAQAATNGFPWMTPSLITGGLGYNPAQTNVAQAWSGSQNFTGPLLQGGVPVLTNASVSAGTAVTNNSGSGFVFESSTNAWTVWSNGVIVAYCNTNGVIYSLSGISIAGASTLTGGATLGANIDMGANHQIVSSGEFDIKCGGNFMFAFLSSSINVYQPFVFGSIGMYWQSDGGGNIGSSATAGRVANIWAKTLVQSGGKIIAGDTITATNGFYVPQTNAAPTAAFIGGSVGSITNHLMRNVNGALVDYWSDGTTLYSKQIAP